MAIRTAKIEKWIQSKIDIDRLSSWGVYRMWHISEPNKIYVGETASIRKVKTWKYGFYTRWCTHINMLQRGVHDIKELQKVVNKKGINGIRFSILEICQSKNESYSREGHYIDSLNPYYNKIHPQIFQFDLNGVFIRKYRNGTSAALITGIDRGSLNNAALGYRPSAGGFLWSFKDKVKVKSRRMVQQFCMDNGLVKEYSSLGEASKAMKTSSSTAIRNAIKGNQRQAYGYKWAYRWT